MSFAHTTLLSILTILLLFASVAFADNECEMPLSAIMSASSKCGGSYPKVDDTSPDCPAPLAKVTDVITSTCTTYSYCMLYDRPRCAMEVESSFLPYLQPVYSEANISMLKSSQFLSPALNNLPEANIPSESTSLIQIPSTDTPLQINYIRPSLISTSDCLSGRTLLTGDEVYCPETDENPFHGQYILEIFKSDINGKPLPTSVYSVNFEIDQNTYLPVQNPSGAAAIIRGPVIDTSGIPLFMTDTSGPVYIGVKLKLITKADNAFEQVDDDNSSRYDKMIYLPYAETVPLSNSSSTDWIRQEKPEIYSAYFPGNYTVDMLAKQIATPPYEIKHFAAEYTLAMTSTPVTYISSCAQLQSLNLTAATRVELTKNINCQAEGITNFQPISLMWPITFDGNSHKISNLSINQPDQDSVGIFKGLPGRSTIRNLILDNLQVKGYRFVGGIVGSTAGSHILVSNVHILPGSKIEGRNDVGGIVGDNRTSFTIRYCSSGADINVSSSSAGGIAGSMKNGEISRSFATGNIIGGDRSNSVGGLLGSVTDGQAVIQESYSTGNVFANDEAGGLIGHAVFASGMPLISNSYATGNVTATVAAAGGLVGYHFIAGAVINSYATGTVTSNEYTGGLLGASGNVTGIFDSFTLSPVYGQGFKGYIKGLNIDMISQIPANEEIPPEWEFWGREDNLYYIDHAGDTASMCAPNGGGSVGISGSCTATQSYATIPDLGWDFENTWKAATNGPPTLRSVAQLP